MLLHNKCACLLSDKSLKAGLTEGLGQIHRTVKVPLSLLHSGAAGFKRRQTHFRSGYKQAGALEKTHPRVFTRKVNFRWHGSNTFSEGVQLLRQVHDRGNTEECCRSAKPALAQTRGRRNRESECKHTEALVSTRTLISVGFLTPSRTSSHLFKHDTRVNTRARAHARASS